MAMQKYDGMMCMSPKNFKDANFLSISWKRWWVLLWGPFFLSLSGWEKAQDSFLSIGEVGEVFVVIVQSCKRKTYINLDETKTKKLEKRTLRRRRLCTYSRKKENTVVCECLTCKQRTGDIHRILPMMTQNDIHMHTHTQPASDRQNKTYICIWSSGRIVNVKFFGRKNNNVFEGDENIFEKGRGENTMRYPCGNGGQIVIGRMQIFLSLWSFYSISFFLVKKKVESGREDKANIFPPE